MMQVIGFIEDKPVQKMNQKSFLKIIIVPSLQKHYSDMFFFYYGYYPFYIIHTLKNKIDVFYYHIY